MAVPLFVLEYWTKLQCIQMVLLTIILRVVSSYCTPFIGYWTTAGTFPNLPGGNTYRFCMSQETSDSQSARSPPREHGQSLL